MTRLRRSSPWAVCTVRSVGLTSTRAVLGKCRFSQRAILAAWRSPLAVSGQS